MKIRNMALCAVFTAIALTVYIIENQIPVPIPVPGLKLGIANIITLITLFVWNKKYSFAILVMRIVLSAVICGIGLNLLYSLSGGIMSFIGICLFKKLTDSKMIPFISVIGAIFHNTGQIAVASFVLKSTSIFIYLPLLSLCSILTGGITGTAAYYIIKNKYINNLFRSVR